jgi:DNA repair exonuclease SbcCD ATPase subunit
LPAGPRPPGRYGHTLNILGSKIYIFGGQVEGYFFNDLVAFDLNALQQASNRWEILIQNTIDGGPPHGQIPPARTNHTMVSWNDKLYLFGGTDGVHWFNDVWSYSPQTNSWTQLECIGYIPSPREGHAAALVGDVMYIFGGRTEEGSDLGDLAAFRISSRRWYTFQNMGPSPSPRSGHSMTTVGKQIVILAGEPSSAPRDPVELGLAYVLDTAKIRYPPDSASQAPANERIQGTRRPSGSEKSGVPTVGGAGRGQPPAELMERQRMGSGDSLRTRNDSASRLPRIAGQQAPSPAPTGPPPQAPGQPRTNGAVTARQPTTTPDRPFSPGSIAERAQRFENHKVSGSQDARNSPAPVETRMPTSPSFAPENTFFDSEDHAEQQTNRRYKPETYQPSQEQNGEGLDRTSSRSQRSRADTDRGEDTPRESVETPSQLPKVRELQQEEHEAPQDSGIGSSPALSQQYDDLVKELEQAKRKNAWYASELALARKSGYQGRTSADSPVLDERATDVFADDDKPLIEALLKMRMELAKVQETIDAQSKNAAERIAEMEKQRDAAINEAVFAKAKLAGQGSPMADGAQARSTPDQERYQEASRKLASSVARQKELSRKIDSLTQELEAEKKHRQLAEETAEMAQKRATELDSYRQRHSSELESLRAELHEAQSAHRELSVSHAEISAQHKMLMVDKNELSAKLESAVTQTQNHTSILQSLRDAIAASTEKAQLLEQKLEQERSNRDDLESKLRALKSEHEAKVGELDNATRRLQDAEELAEKYRVEAKSHREAVLAGLDKAALQDATSSSAADERVAILQEQIAAANAMVKQNKAAADAAAQKLRGAEERIAGLEAYQEQASREGLSIRSQIQALMKQNQALAAEKAEAEQKLQSQMLETNALHVQHSSLKDILAERGINPADVRRSRALDSPSSLSKRMSTPDIQRVRDLEQQLEASLKSHEEMKAQFEEVSERDEKMKREYEEKLTALDNDHQAAVKYLRGTEKMLSKMKQELQRVKNENAELRKKVQKVGEDGSTEGSKRGSPEVPSEWEAEREKLKQEIEQAQAELKTSVSNLEDRIREMESQLRNTETQLEQTKVAHATSQADLTSLQATHTQTRDDMNRLQKENGMLEDRARDAENKVQLLLDQVEHSVDNYRRQSRMPEGGPTTNGNGGFGHQRGLSGSSNATSTTTGTNQHIGGEGHSRNLSEGAESNFSGREDGRDSMALDSLATELETLRSHWETTNKNYRLSDKFDFERTPTATSPPSSSAGGPGSSNASTASASGTAGPFGGLASWRQNLDIGEDDESRPTTADGSVVGENVPPTVHDGQHHGSASAASGQGPHIASGMI